jgi:hypothetical protein
VKLNCEFSRNRGYFVKSRQSVFTSGEKLRVAIQVVPVAIEVTPVMNWRHQLAEKRHFTPVRQFPPPFRGGLEWRDFTN